MIWCFYGGNNEELWLLGCDDAVWLLYVPYGVIIPQKTAFYRHSLSLLNRSHSDQVLGLDSRAKFRVNSFIPSKRMLLHRLEAEHAASCSPRRHHPSHSNGVFWKEVLQIRSWTWIFRINSPEIVRSFQAKERSFGAMYPLYYQVTRMGELETALAVNTNRSTLRSITTNNIKTEHTLMYRCGNIVLLTLRFFTWRHNLNLSPLVLQISRKFSFSFTCLNISCAQTVPSRGTNNCIKHR
jgi:hypothetical protein